MKKLLKQCLASLLILMMALSLVACSEGGGNGDDNQEPEQSVATQLDHGKVWSAPSSVKIEQADVKYADKQEAKLSYQAVKNEYESQQLLISAEQNITHFELQTADLKKGDAVLSKDNVTVYVEKYVYYSEAIGNGYMPDPLIPMDAADEYEENVIESGKNGAFWVTIYIPKETEAGLYEGTFKLGIKGDKGEETLDIPVSVNVYDYTLTDEVNARNLFSWRYLRVGSGELDGSIEMMEKYYDFAKEYRVSLQSLPVETLSAEEYVDAVIEHYDEISNFCILNQKGDMTGGVYLEKYRDIVTQEILALAEHSTAEKNLFDKACIYTIDEPHITEEAARKTLISQLEQINGMLQEIADLVAADKTGRFSEFKKIPDWKQSIVDMPNIVTLNFFSWLLENENTEDGQAILNGLNCICPVFTSVTDESMERLESMCEKYDLDLWWYGCVTPRPPAPTYHISDPNLLSSRTVSWLQSKYEVQGNLYWDMAGYTYENLEESLFYAVDLYESPYHLDAWPAGDGFLLYPGAAYGVYGPIGSLRLMSIRDGMEEYEILEDLKTSLKENPDAFDASVSVDSIMDMFYSPVALSTKKMYTDGEENLDFIALRKNLLEFVTGYQTGLGFVVGNVQITGTKAEVTYFVQDGATVLIDDQVQQAKDGNKYIYEMNLEEDVYIHVTVKNAEGETKKYDQYIGTPLYTLNALSDDSAVSGVTVTEGSAVELVTNDAYSVDGTALHLNVNGVVTGDVLQDATFKPSVTFDFSLFGDADVAALKIMRMNIFNVGEEATMTVKIYSGTSFDSLGEYQLKAGDNTLELDLTKLISGMGSADSMVFEFDNINEDGTPKTFEFYVDNIVGE